MKLNAGELANREQWLRGGFKLPAFDIRKVTAHTRANPTWVHFGAGNIFRAFPAVRLQELLDAGLAESGVIVAEGFDYEIIDAAFTPHDNLSLAVTLKSDGGIDKTVVASMTEALKADPSHPDFQRLKEVFRSPTLQMVSFTITEKGYSLHRGESVVPEIAEDFAAGPGAPKSHMGKVASLLYERFLAGGAPLALVSMDNCSRNGEKLYEAVYAFATAWVENRLVDKGFSAYVESPTSLSFPWTMIDKITPSPDESVKRRLLADGFEDVETRITGKNSAVAAFVNAEETEYLVVEDSFPNGRPALEKAGVLFCDRDTVDKAEKMKVCTCLNPLHTAMSIYGCLLSFERIFDVMRDPDIRRMVEILGYREALPTVVDPGIINPREFLDTCFKVRWANPFMPDTPQRIAMDTSQKMPIRFGDTIRTYIERPDLDVDELTIIPLVHAGWCRYLMGVDDAGKAFTPSADPLLDTLRKHFEGVRLGDSGPFGKRLRPLLSDAGLFGLDLYAAGLGEKVEGYFSKLVAGPGAVRSTLKKYTG